MNRARFDVESLMSSLMDADEAVLAVTQAACTLMEARPDLSPYDAVCDVLQVYRCAQELLRSPRQ